MKSTWLWKGPVSGYLPDDAVTELNRTSTAWTSSTVRLVRQSVAVLENDQSRHADSHSVSKARREKHHHTVDSNVSTWLYMAYYTCPSTPRHQA